jgi:type I restriction enzyme R subunit
MFGFTGTPIFAENAVKNELGKRTTKELFGECLHKYVITDAINDENVLRFSVEYVGRYKQKEDSRTNIDIEVEDIDTAELMNSPIRLNKIVDYIIDNHSRKTHSRTFTAMFCVNSVDTLIAYYELFKQKKEEGKHNLKIATIFSYTANEEDQGADGSYNFDFNEESTTSLMAAEPMAVYGKKEEHSRDKLESFIGDYNMLFGTKFSTKDSVLFYNYYNDISKKVKEKQIDILLVVNMFLTGFDSPGLNTLYVDKNLKYHGLIQAYSRTNRILDELKSQGNILSFRNLKKATDDAIALFSNKDAKDVIIMQPYEDYVSKFNEAYESLLKLVPTVDSVNELNNETSKLEFVKAFRELMRIKNILTTFSDFTHDGLEMNEQEFEDYKSKYLDIYETVRKTTEKEKVSILEDVDFELELIHRDEINVNYILNLLAGLKESQPNDLEKKKKEIVDLLTGDPTLRTKRELIERFIQENLPIIQNSEDVSDEFERYWTAEQIKAFKQIVAEENLSEEKTEKLIETYLFAEREPLRNELLDLIEGEKPKLLERKTIGDRLLSKILDFVDTFINGVK